MRSTSGGMAAPSARGVGRCFSSSAILRMVIESPSMAGPPTSTSTIVKQMPHTSVHGPASPKRFGAHCSGAP